MQGVHYVPAVLFLDLANLNFPSKSLHVPRGKAQHDFCVQLISNVRSFRIGKLSNTNFVSHKRPTVAQFLNFFSKPKFGVYKGEMVFLWALTRGWGRSWSKVPNPAVLVEPRGSWNGIENILVHDQT